MACLNLSPLDICQNICDHIQVKFLHAVACRWFWTFGFFFHLGRCGSITCGGRDGLFANTRHLVAGLWLILTGFLLALDCVCLGITRRCRLGIGRCRCNDCFCTVSSQPGSSFQEEAESHQELSFSASSVGREAAVIAFVELSGFFTSSCLSASECVFSGVLSVVVGALLFD